jgi:hypothetical protein
VVLTAALSPREKQRMKDYPVADLIAKPFDVEVLLASVKKCSGGEGIGLGNVLSSGMLFFIAEMIQRRWM